MLEVDLIILISLFRYEDFDSVSFPCTWKKKRSFCCQFSICDVISSQSSHLAPNAQQSNHPCGFVSLVRSRTLRPMCRSRKEAYQKSSFPSKAWYNFSTFKSHYQRSAEINAPEC